MNTDSSKKHGDTATMTNTIDQLTSRHIARLLSKLGDTVAPVVESEIKREFRFLAEDIKQVNTENTHEQEEQENAGNC
jgi:hypothetical protein